MISVARIDILTVVAKITDSAASFITDDTEVEIAVNNLPGEKRFGRVTRHSPSIQNSDRTMRVEVDLYNGKEKDYGLAVARVFASMLSPLSARDPFASAVVGFASRDLISGLHKGDCDCFPLDAHTPNGTYVAGRLLPGMTVTMKLSLRHENFSNCGMPQ